MLFRSKWKLIDQTANNNWTTDDQSWQSFKKSILQTPNLNRLHFMGGEPLLNKKFVELLDFLIECQLTDISISFVSNGTMVYDNIIRKLKKFKSCDIEISLESVKPNNHYIRQGSDTNDIKKTVKQLISNRTDNFNVVLRTVPQLLNVNNYHELINWAWQNQIAIVSIPLTEPEYLQISVLPLALRKGLIPQYQDLLNRIKDCIPERNGIVSGRNTSEIESILARHIETIISMLSVEEPGNLQQLQAELISWLTRWDKEFGLDARDFYPEYCDFLEENGYAI